jgi:hypothetical protein
MNPRARRIRRLRRKWTYDQTAGWMTRRDAAKCGLVPIREKPPVPVKHFGVKEYGE